MLFRVESEIPPTVQIRLKVEINCFEHFNVLGLTKVLFRIENSWFTGEAELTTYHFEIPEGCSPVYVSKAKPTARKRSRPAKAKTEVQIS